MEEPVLKVVKGEPTPDEIAAVVAAVRLKLSERQPAGTTRPVRSGWAAYWRQVRRPITPGANAWRRSALPH